MASTALILKCLKGEGKMWENIDLKFLSAIISSVIKPWHGVVLCKRTIAKLLLSSPCDWRVEPQSYLPSKERREAGQDTSPASWAREQLSRHARQAHTPPPFRPTANDSPAPGLRSWRGRNMRVRTHLSVSLFFFFLVDFDVWCLTAAASTLLPLLPPFTSTNVSV